MLNRYVEVTDEYVKQLEHEIDILNAINEEHKKINGKLREEYNKIQSLYESVFVESKKQKEVIDKVDKILNECKLLMPHEFDWEEQVDNVLDILKEVSE